MGDNGEDKIKTQAETPNLGRAETVNLGQAGNPTEPEVKPEPEKPITDFKIAEIWVRSGQIMLDAAPNFWQDRCRALGVLLLCQDIVRTAKAPEPEKSKIITPKNSLINFARNGFRRKR